MRIAVIGAGAMGSVYGGLLSERNEVWLIDSRSELVDRIREEGLLIEEEGSSRLYRPRVSLSAEGLPEMDLVILFVKAFSSEEALRKNRKLIGKGTRLLSLQNGSGHEEILGQFAKRERIIIGTTEDNGAVLGLGHVRRGGSGKTNVGMLCEDREAFLPRLKESFDACGFSVRIYGNIQQLIWDKLFINSSLSAVTGILQVKMGYISADEHAWNLCCALIHEAAEAARALGLCAEEEEIRERVRRTSLRSPEGITSICADLRDGRRTEVDTISGSVVRAAQRLGIEVPCQRFVVDMIHAMEKRGCQAGSL